MSLVSDRIVFQSGCKEPKSSHTRSEKTSLGKHTATLEENKTKTLWEPGLQKGSHLGPRWSEYPFPKPSLHAPSQTHRSSLLLLILYLIPVLAILVQFFFCLIDDTWPKLLCTTLFCSSDSSLKSVSGSLNSIS